MRIGSTIAIVVLFGFAGALSPLWLLILGLHFLERKFEKKEPIPAIGHWALWSSVISLCCMTAALLIPKGSGLKLLLMMPYGVVALAIFALLLLAVFQDD